MCSFFWVNDGGIRKAAAHESKILLGATLIFFHFTVHILAAVVIFVCVFIYMRDARAVLER